MKRAFPTITLENGVVVQPFWTRYYDGTLCVILRVHGDQKVNNDQYYNGEDWGRATVNLGDPSLLAGQAYVDTNMGEYLVDLLEAAGLAHRDSPAVFRESGFCTYPRMTFNLDRIKES